MDTNDLITAIFIGMGTVMMLYVIAMWYWTRIAQSRLDHDLQELKLQLDQQRLIPLTVELHGDQFLCFNSLTQDFVCQGASLTEIKERFQQRYPNKSAAIHRGEDSVLQTLKQQIQGCVE